MFDIFTDLFARKTKGRADAAVLASNQANIKTGVTILGTTGTLCADATAVAGDIKAPATAYGSAGTKLTGTMLDKAANNVEVADLAGTLIPAGSYNGSGKAILSAAEIAKCITGNIKAGITLLGVAGKTEVVDTVTGDAANGDILASKIAFVAGTQRTGTMVDRGTVSTDISAVATEVTIAAGKHSGSGVVKIAAAEQAKLIAGNIRAGQTILGVAGDTNVVDTTSGDAAATEIKVGKKAWVDGAEVTGTKYYWIEDYAGGVGGLFYPTYGSANLPASVTLYAPLATYAEFTFRAQTANLTTLDVTLSNNVADLTSCFHGCTKLVTITLHFTTASATTFFNCFSGCTVLATITGELSLNAATTLTTMFSGCTALANVTFTGNTIKSGLSFAGSPLLSSASLVSIGNGLLEAASAKTLTMHATSKTAMNALMGDITGAEGSQVFTANPAGADTLTHFITDHKVWTIA
jgi:hypothetical protein